MRIDRSRFLLLASAIAAGCGPRGQTPPRDPTATNDADAADRPVASAATPPKHSMPPPSREGDPVGEWGAADEGSVDPAYAEGLPPSAEGWMPPPSAEGGGAPLPSISGMGVPLSSWTCNGSDDAGKPPFCAIKVPKSCAPFPFVGQSCRGARTYFKPKIAERAVSCMHKLTPDAVCSAMTYECRDAALKSACPDPIADQACVVLAKTCPQMSQVECRTYMNGLNAAGRAEVFKCMSQPSGCGYGVYSCVEGLND